MQNLDRPPRRRQSHPSMKRALLAALCLINHTLAAQIMLTPENREVVITSDRLAEGYFPGHNNFLLFQPEVDYAGLRSAPVDNANNAVSQQIQAWYEEGSAAGNVGDYYENRDGGHSHLNLDRFGQFTKLVYGPELSNLGADFGVKIKINSERPTLANASLAMKNKPFERSMARLILHNPEINPELYTMYRLGQICIYPEHSDHDTDSGDVFAANTPYLIITQGSSGSDKAFLNTVANTLASFHPAVKETLHQRGLLAPTIQMLLRWNLAGADQEAYLTGNANPTVFKRKDIKLKAMVEMAHAMTTDCLPPLAQIKVTSETTARPGVDHFDGDSSEVLLDSPCAVARIARNLDYQRTFRVSAAESIDARNWPLNYHWVVLRGDPDKINIRPLNRSKTEAEITVDYHPQTNVDGAPDLRSHRVDIGVFVDNGKYFSPPAFISIYYPPHEQRIYNEAGQLESVTYQRLEDVGRIADPTLFFNKPWSDAYNYQNGQLTGWTRTYDNGDVENFRADGSPASADSSGPPTYVIGPEVEGYRAIERP